MADKSFPASEQKLQRLRDEGRFPASRDLSTAALVIALGAAWLTFPFKQLRDVVAASLAFQGTDVLSIIRLWVSMVVPPLALFAAAVLISWLIQTRFAIRFSRRRGHREGRRRPLVRALASVSKAALVSVTALFLLISDVRQLGGESRVGFESRLALRSGQPLETCGSIPLPPQCATSEIFGTGLGGAFSVLAAVSCACLLLSFLLGILSRFVAGLDFQYEHRMTRAELEAEARENESPPLLREVLESERWPEITES